MSRLRRPLRALPILVVLVAGGACRVRESPEAVRAKATKEFLGKQLVSLQALLAKAERGELVTADQIAIGVDEAVARELLNASLPLEQVVGGHARIRIESVEPLFRGNQPALLFQARVTSEDMPDHFAELELGGSLQDLKLVDGRLAGRAHIAHFTVRKASVGPLAQGLVETLVRNNLSRIQDVIPRFEVPVRLDQQVVVDRFQEGPVEAKGGKLPLVIELSQVVAMNQRMWVLIDAKAGPWQASPAAAEKEKKKAGR